MKPRSGIVALAGRPNAGKSTLMNRLLTEKVAIVSDKPQTTRHVLIGILSSELEAGAMARIELAPVGCTEGDVCWGTDAPSLGADGKISLSDATGLTQYVQWGNATPSDAATEAVAEGLWPGVHCVLPSLQQDQSFELNASDSRLVQQDL